LFTQALVRREAVLSSRIEGTRASLSDLVLALLTTSSKRSIPSWTATAASDDCLSSCC